MRDINDLLQCRTGFYSDEEWMDMDIEDLAIVSNAFAKALQDGLDGHPAIEWQNELWEKMVDLKNSIEEEQNALQSN